MSKKEKKSTQHTKSYVQKLRGSWSLVAGFMRHHRTLLLYTVFGLTITGLIAGTVYFSLPASAQFESQKIAVNEPIKVAFSHPTRSSVAYSIQPYTKGTWHTSKDVLGGVTKLSFQAAQPLRPHTTYHLILTDVHALLGTASKSTETLALTTKKLQPVAVINPLPNTPIPIDSKVVVRMPFPNNRVRKLVLTSSDAKLASLDPTTTDEMQFVWHFAEPLAQGTTYHLELKDMNRPADQQFLQNIIFNTVSEPQVTQATTTDHLYPDQPILVAFNQDMIPSAKDFTFSCKGTGKWQDAHTYNFIPARLAPATTCSYTLLKGSRDKQGGVVEADHTYTASSPGAAQAITMSPRGSGISLGSAITVAFDQPVDHASAQGAFSITPNVSGTFTWNANSMTFHPAGLDYQTAYSVVVKPGIAATYGLASTASFSSSFTTVAQVIKLAVPSYRQQYALSCEESSLRMALAYRGIMVSDMDVLQQVGYNPHPRNTTTNTWDNPYAMYVGDVNGQEAVTGWGAYGPPIAAASQKLGRSASYVSGITPQQISQAIHDNNPVVLWGVVAGQTPRLDSWNTPDGSVVTVAANAHVRTVFGVVGSPSDPIGFYVHDPLHPDIYWTTAQLEANMTADGRLSSQGVVVQ